MEEIENKFETKYLQDKSKSKRIRFLMIGHLNLQILSIVWSKENLQAV